MSYKITTNWDPDTNCATTSIKNCSNGIVFLGTAKCHPDDETMASEHIGLEIANARAQLNIIRSVRDNELKPQLKILKHLYSNIKTSKQFNPKSYEATMLRRQIKHLESELSIVKDIISDYKNYIEEMGNAVSSYKIVRERRKLDEDD